jgi:anti-sigma factor RsiW
MADCSEISLMLGAFEDGELEPHEYQSVAFHLARCEKCTAELADYSMLGRELRSAIAEPALAGFTQHVMQRIEGLPTPLSVKISRFFNRISDQIGSGLSMATAAAVAAILTVFLAAPFATNLARRTGAVPEMAARQISKIETAAESAPAQLASAQSDVNEATQDSHAVISRLESEIPSVAVWSEPQNDTTVIWLPDQQ